MQWYEKYLGKPWACIPEPPYSYNCGELVRAVYMNELAIDSPAIAADPENYRSVVRDCRDLERYGPFAPVDNTPREFDLVELYKGSLPDHVGVWTGRGILHCVRGAGVVHETLTELFGAGFRKFIYNRHERFRNG